VGAASPPRRRFSPIFYADFSIFMGVFLKIVCFIGF